MRHLILLIVVLGLFVPAGIVRAQEDKQDQDTVTKADAEKADEKKAEEKEEELTLERLFPEKSFFGPSLLRLSLPALPRAPAQFGPVDLRRRNRRSAADHLGVRPVQVPGSHPQGS